MFRKFASGIVWSTLGTKNMANLSNNNSWKEGILRKRKGRTPDKIKRFKSSALRSSSIEGKKQCEKRFLTEPTSYFASKRLRLLSIQSANLALANCRILAKPEHSDGKNSSLSNILVALDCEMVECQGVTNSLARCSIINYDGQTVLDLFVKQTLRVVDYRTPHSGMTKKLLNSDTCVTFLEAQKQVKKAIEGKLLVGHSIHNDLTALEMSHPKQHTIDIGYGSARKLIDQYREKYSLCLNRSSLKFFAKQLLDRKIQHNRHCSVEDATATLDIFKLVENEWLATHRGVLDSSILQEDSYFEDKYWPSHIMNE
uniref:RNA exonuclease 4-like n=1 Tax=Styela clava TaxID=7725 RepID=UPI00193A5286|nr:RNA exonuclease 4-like [Styela clava]